MGKIAFIFPGQGAQYTGMGRELAECSQTARAVFDAADLIRPGTSEQCFSGSLEELTETKNTQPCMFAAELAAAMALNEAGIKPDAAAGFSLGELSALAFTGAVSLEDGFRLVTSRGLVMQAATVETDASMAAVLKLDDETVIALCAGVPQLYPVNFNSPGQVVVSGVRESLDALTQLVREKGGRVLPLKVGGGFHSPFMSTAQHRFMQELAAYTIHTPQIPLYANYTALPYGSEPKELLAKQIVNPVLWSRTITNMIAAGIDTFIEVGPGKVLSGLVSRISGDVRILNVEDSASLQKTIAEV